MVSIMCKCLTCSNMLWQLVALQACLYCQKLSNTLHCVMPLHLDGFIQCRESVLAAFPSHMKNVLFEGLSRSICFLRNSLSLSFFTKCSRNFHGLPISFHVLVNLWGRHKSLFFLSMHFILKAYSIFNMYIFWYLGGFGIN